uniref:Si:ch73-252i11.1 n=1 Tax=Myripristis murdjan TaxID=586833 RepID=A0A667WWT4_9TELE
MSEAEAAVLKLICANHGSMSVDDLEESVCVFNVRRIISNREKFVCCRSGGEHKVVAKTELRLCKAKVCQGCNNLHLCRKFLLGSCPSSRRRRGCQFPHQLRSDHNVPILVEHGLQDLDRAELCTLLLQNDNFLLPPVSTTPNYNKGDGPFGECRDGDGCTKLHICEKHLHGDCSCYKAHDFHEPHPSKTLQARGVPAPLINTLKYVYINKEALRGNRGNRGNQQHPARANAAYTCIHVKNIRLLPKIVLFACVPSDKTEICLYFIKGHCKHDKCFKAHYKLPYRWELRQGQQWTALPDSEEIEKDYCVPKKTYSRGVEPVCFDTMTRGSSAVRRLSTASSVLHPDFVLTTEWLWYWEDEFGNWNQYASATAGHSAASISGAELEQKYLNDDKSVVEFTAGSQKYSLSFKDMIQTNKQYGTKRLVRRRPAFVSSADAATAKVRKPQSNSRGVPAYWDKTQIPETGYKRVSLQRSSEEFKRIEGLFCNTMAGFDIVQIERIQNKKLWEFYDCQKNYMKKNNAGRNVQEKKLFHGTDSKHVHAICHDNFDWRICGTHGTAFGRGSYFARDAKYSHSYTGQSDVKSMFVSLVLVGQYTRGSSDYVRPPSKDGGDVHFYDSCVDDVRNPSIFVVFEKHQIYPEYLLQYQEKTSNIFRDYYGAASPPAPKPVSAPVRQPRPQVTPARPQVTPARPAARPATSSYSTAYSYPSSSASSSSYSTNNQQESCVIL